MTTRSEIIMRSAEYRLDLLLEPLRQQDEAFRAAEHAHQLREASWSDPGPTTEKRRKLDPLWGWKKLMRRR